MSTTDYKILERIFAAEIENRLPAQVKSKHLARLEAEGLIRTSTKELYGRFPVTITGWELTLLGNLTFCMECDRREPEEV